MPDLDEMPPPPPLSKEERLELEAFKQSLKDDFSDMSEAAVRHVERVIAPFASLQARVDGIETRLHGIERQATSQSTRMETLETHTTAQTKILEVLQVDAVKNKKDRIARRKERITRKAADEAWRKNRRWIAFGITLITAAGELYHNCFSHTP
jgi:hypothetical protein